MLDHQHRPGIKTTAQGALPAHSYGVATKKWQKPRLLPFVQFTYSRDSLDNANTSQYHCHNGCNDGNDQTGHHDIQVGFLMGQSSNGEQC